MNKKDQLKKACLPEDRENYPLPINNCPLLAQRIWPSRMGSKPCFGKTHHQPTRKAQYSIHFSDD